LHSRRQLFIRNVSLAFEAYLETFNPFDKDGLCREVFDVLFHATRIASMVYLLKKIYEVAEEYGILVAYMEEAYTSSSCPIHGGCGKRIKRGAFKYTKLNKVFNSDLVGAYNILITPSPNWDRGDGPETRLWIEPSERGDIILNLPALAGTLAFWARKRSDYSNYRVLRNSSMNRLGR